MIIFVLLKINESNMKEEYNQTIKSTPALHNLRRWKT